MLYSPPDLQGSITRIHRTIELMYSDKSMMQVSTFPRATFEIHYPCHIRQCSQLCWFHLMSSPGPLSTSCSSGARRPSQRRPLLGLHLRPAPALLDEVQRHRRNQVVMGGASEGLIWRLPQRQRLLSDVHQWQEAFPHRRYNHHASELMSFKKSSMISALFCRSFSLILDYSKNWTTKDFSVVFLSLFIPKSQISVCYFKPMMQFNI